jgi:hypothetical protein
LARKIAVLNDFAEDQLPALQANGANQPDTPNSEAYSRQHPDAVPVGARHLSGKLSDSAHEDFAADPAFGMLARQSSNAARASIQSFAR